MNFGDQRSQLISGRNNLAAEACNGGVWSRSWPTSALSLPVPILAGSVLGPSTGPLMPCWMSGLDTDVAAVLASLGGRPSARAPGSLAPNPQSPSPRGPWPALIRGLLAVAYLSMAVLTAICAWMQPASGMIAVVPVVVLGGWVILQPIMGPRSRRRRR